MLRFVSSDSFRGRRRPGGAASRRVHRRASARRNTQTPCSPGQQSFSKTYWIWINSPASLRDVEANRVGRGVCGKLFASMRVHSPDCTFRACAFHRAGSGSFQARGTRPKTHRPTANAAARSRGWFRIAPRGKNTGTPLPGIVARRDMSTNRMEVLKAMVAQNPADAFARYGLAMELVQERRTGKRGGRVPRVAGAQSQLRGRVFSRRPGAGEIGRRGTGARRFMRKAWR